MGRNSFTFPEGVSTSPENGHGTSDDASFIEAARIADAPDFVDVGGVRYYREQKPYDASKDGTEVGFSKIVINIAPHASYIRLDNRFYYNGYEYTVRDDQVATFMEIMQKTWQHEASTGGANSNLVGAKNTVYNLRTQGHRNFIGPPGVPGA